MLRRIIVACSSLLFLLLIAASAVGQGPAGLTGASVGSFALLTSGGGWKTRVALSADGRIACLGEGIALTVLDVSDRSRPVRAGALRLPEEVTGVAIDGNLAYVSAYGEGLLIVDISTPGQPLLRGQYRTGSYVYGVAVAGGRAYLVGSNALEVVDVTQPSTPTRLGGCEISEGRDVAASGNYVYVATGYSAGNVQVIDVTDPQHPRAVGNLATPRGLPSLCLAGTRLYAAGGSGGVYIVDVANPIAPALLGSYDTPGFAGGVAAQGQRVYVADGPQGLLILDATNPAQPQPLGSTGAAWRGDSIAVSGSHAWLVDFNKGLRVLNVGNPAQPAVLGDYDRPGVVLDAGVAPAAGSAPRYGCLVDAERLWTMDLTDPVAARPLAAFRLLGQPKRLTLAGSLAYVAHESAGTGLEVVNLADPLRPQRLGQLPLPGDTQANDVAIAGPYAYLATVSSSGSTATDGHLRIVAVSNPAAPAQVAIHDTPGDARRVTVAGAVAYVADGPAGLRILNVANPAQVTEVGHLDPPVSGAQTHSVAVQGRRAYVGSYAWGKGANSWLQIVDVSDPAHPTVLDTYPLNVGAREIEDIEVRDGHAFLAVAMDGLWCLEVVNDRVALGGRQPTLHALGVAIIAPASGQAGAQSGGFYDVLAALRSPGYDLWRYESSLIPTATPTASRSATATATATPRPTQTATPSPTPIPPSASWVKRAEPEVVAPGEEIEFTVILNWNSYNGQAAGAGMTDPIPQYTEYIRGTARANMGAVNDADPTRITWTGAIPDGGAAVISFRVRVRCDQLMRLSNSEWPGEIRNRATGNIGPFAYAVAKDVGLLKPDLQITAVEVTQAVQNLTNQVPLIWGKETYVRLFVKAEYPETVGEEVVYHAGCDVPLVTARLVGPGGQVLRPLNRSITARVLRGQERPTQAERDALSECLYFRLAGDWRTEDYHLLAEVNPERDRPDRFVNNNERTEDIRFQKTREVELVYRPVRYTEGGANLQPDQKRAVAMAEYLRLYPVAEGRRRFVWGYPLRVDWSLADVAGRSRLLSVIDEQRAFGRVQATSHVGLVHTDVPTGDSVGRGLLPGQACFVKYTDNLEYDGMSLIHELGHNLGRRHVPCETQDDTGGTWPYPPCQLSDGTRTGYYGFDTQRPLLNVRDPRTHSDFMGYGVRVWVSDFTYRGLYGVLQPAAAGLGAGAQDLLLVRGLVTATQGTGQLDAAYRVQSAFQNATSGGPYTLQLQDSQGQVLQQDTFDAVMKDARGQDEDGAGTPFLRALPYDARAARIVLLRAGQVLASRVASAHPPTVRLTMPNGGETVTGTLTIVWEGSDADGDPLEYVLQYSVDGGATWQALATRLRSSPYRVDAGDLPGGARCLVQVIASDGFHTAYDRSDALFSVPPKPPTVWLLSPQEGQRYGSTALLILQGQAHDQALQPLPPEALSWSSDRDGPLGQGEEAAVQTLSAGWHRITLTAVDGAGLTTSETVSIMVGNLTWLPLLQKP